MTLGSLSPPQERHASKVATLVSTCFDDDRISAWICAWQPKTSVKSVARSCSDGPAAVAPSSDADVDSSSGSNSGRSTFQ